VGEPLGEAKAKKWRWQQWGKSTLAIGSTESNRGSRRNTKKGMKNEGDGGHKGGNDGGRLKAREEGKIPR